MRAWAASFLRDPDPGPARLVLRAALVPPACVYGGLAALRVRAYQAGVVQARRLPRPVISVGNLEVGGTGKTPFVRLLAERLLGRGLRPLVLARGYGARSDGPDLDEEGRSLARDLPGVTVIQHRNRAAAGLAALQRDPELGVVVLDDGAQHLRVHRDLEILLVDAAAPFGCGWPLPAGPLREMPGALRRAHLVVMTRSAGTPPEVLQRSRELVARASRGRPLVEAGHVPARLLPSGRPEDLEGRRVMLVSGIARPESFRSTAEALGARVVAERVFPDHFAYSEAHRSAVEAEAAAAGAELLVATGKDEPKLRPLLRAGGPCWRFLEVAVRLGPEASAGLDRALSRILGGEVDGSPSQRS